jgi:uncharacterized protein (TIRG00374 family)
MSTGPTDSEKGATNGRRHRWPVVSTSRIVELVIELVAIYVLWPWLSAVYSSFGALRSLNPLWFVAMVGLEIASFACMWVLIAISLRSTRWFLIGTSQIVGYAVGLVVPGGNPAGTATQIYLLVHGGLDTPRATTGVMAAGLINLATLFALPVLAVPAILAGVEVGGWLASATWIALGAFVVLTAVLLLMLLADRPIESIGGWVQWAHNFLVRRSPPLTGLPERLSTERTRIRAALQARWGQAVLASACNWLFDYLVLLAALTAVGAHVNWAVVLLVYTATVWLAIVPVTPGGVGFVEAGLLGMLMLSGVPAPQATLATLSYRLVAYVGPVAVGLPTYWWYQRRLAAVAEAQVVAP